MGSPAIEPAREPLDLPARLRERLEGGRFELPLLEGAAAEVLAACGREDRDAGWLSERVRRDPALAAHVLRIANSAAFAPREPIVSLAQAISRLGLKTLRDVALAAALQAQVFAVPGHEARLAALWRHSSTAGAWAGEIARARRRNVEGAFLCGLLHDVGKAVLLQLASSLERELALAFDPEGLEPALDLLHAEVGGALAARWQLPEWVGAAIVEHHAVGEDSGAQSAGMHADEARTIWLADRLAHLSCGRAAGVAELVGSPVAAALALYPDELEELWERRGSVDTLAGAFL